MHKEFEYHIGGKDFRSSKPTFFNKRKKRRHGHGGAPNRHPGLAEKEIPAAPQMPSDPPPAAFAASVFGLLDAKLQYAIADAGYAVPTPIQEQSIPHLLKGRDLIGCAQTGTGKTAAFMLPILDRLLKEGPNPAGRGDAGHPRALVLSPTRELAAQTAENVALYAKYAGIPFAVVFGGVSQFPQVKALQKGADVVIATPGRLMDLMSQGVVFLDKVEMFVLDEADRMLDMGFLPDIKRIISKLPKARQSLFFSATMGPAIRQLAGALVTDPVQVTISPETPTVEKINQRVMFVDKANRDALLVHLLKEHPEWSKVIVFTKMRHGADRVNKKLFRAGIACAAIHSDKTQNQRTRALDGFRRGDIRVLVATDIASRGIDVPEVSCVVNMELPLETESYVHRIGRTARAGESGAAISFVTEAERGQLKAIERFIKKSIRVDRDHPFHSAFADQKSGKADEGLPTAPWIAPRKAGDAPQPHKPPHGGKPHKPRKRHAFAGRRQPDFGQKRHPGA